MVFITADYAFGHAAQADGTRFVEAAGGTVVGAVRYPFGTTNDFSSFLLRAQGSGAMSLRSPMPGGTDRLPEAGTGVRHRSGWQAAPGFDDLFHHRHPGHGAAVAKGLALPRRSIGTQRSHPCLRQWVRPNLRPAPFRT